MVEIILSAIAAFVITAALMPVVIRVSKLKGLHDLPDFRKVHQKPIPALGGIGIFAGVVAACLVFYPFTQGQELQYFVLAALILFFTGLKDDLVVISPFTKFVAQLLAALALIIKVNLRIANLHGLLGLYQLPAWFAFVLTLVVMVFIINAFNLIDGVDGLAGTLGLISAAIFGCFFYVNGLGEYTLVAFVLVGALCGFLLFNISPARIFMGDTGALLVGLVNALLFVKFLDSASGYSSRHLAPAPGLGLAIICIPMLDAFRVFCYRILKGQSPFFPDRNHIHHILLAKGLSHRWVTGVLALVTILMVALVALCADVNVNLLVPGVFLLFYVIVFLFRLFPVKAAVASHVKEEPAVPA